MILTGERLIYYLLNQHDPDFRELFKVAADFGNEMDWDEDSSLAYAHLIADLAEKENLRHCDQTAVARVIEQSARIAGDSEKLSVSMQSIANLLRESDYWASTEGVELELEGRIVGVVGRKIVAKGYIRANGVKTARCEAMFVMPPDGVKSSRSSPS